MFKNNIVVTIISYFGDLAILAGRVINLIVDLFN